MKQKITSIVTLICAALLAIGPWTMFKPCIPTAEKIMKCHWCCRAIIPIAVILVVIAVLQLLAKEAGQVKLLSVVAAVSFVMPILLTTVIIGGCMKPEMACNVLAFPVINVISVIGIVLQVINLLIKKK